VWLIVKRGKTINNQHTCGAWLSGIATTTTTTISAKTKERRTKTIFLPPAHEWKTKQQAWWGLQWCEFLISVTSTGTRYLLLYRPKSKNWRAIIFHSSLVGPTGSPLVGPMVSRITPDTYLLATVSTWYHWYQVTYGPYLQHAMFIFCVLLVTCYTKVLLCTASTRKYWYDV